MLSFGTEAARALLVAAPRVLFAFGSPLPPSRAATSTNRRSFANSLLRLASAAPFLRLIVAHFECPDMASHLPEQVAVEPRLADELRVEGCHDEVALLEDDWGAVELAEDLHALTDVADDRRADEDAAHRIIDALHVEIRFERVDLTPVGVALDLDVDEREQRLVESDHALRHHDHPRARPED